VSLHEPGDDQDDPQRHAQQVERAAEAVVALPAEEQRRPERADAFDGAAPDG
jgi:hypothetical protein